MAAPLENTTMRLPSRIGLFTPSCSQWKLAFTSVFQLSQKDSRRYSFSGRITGVAPATMNNASGSSRCRVRAAMLGSVASPA